MGEERLEVLLIEDDQDDCVLIREILAETRAPRYHLSWRSTFEDALKATESSRYDAYLLDYRLGEHDGIEFLHEMKARGSNVPIIFLTGQGNYEIDMEAMRSGAAEYLVKDQISGPLLERSIRYAIERKRSEERLRQSEERYRRVVETRYYRLVENVPILIFRLSRDFNLDFVNQACLPILGYTPREARGTSGWFMDRICSNDRARVKRLLENAFGKSGYSFSTECRLAHRDGRPVYALLKCICCTDSDVEGDLECLEGILVDITERVLLEKMLLQKEKLETLGTIVAEVAHEIRNPLVCIGGFAKRLQSRFSNSIEADIILRESNRLEKILSRIRDYLTPVEISPRECMISPVIAQCVELLSPNLRAKHVTCRLGLNEELPTVLADPDILTQVCINLINNALTATTEGGELSITAYETDRNLHISFKNPASGIKLKKPELLFLPFDEGGESIGLPLCFQLLKKMGGILSCRQEDDHVIFTISVPTMQNELQPHQ
ncbi:MAG: response regulator [Syntrophobacter sp.]